MESDQDKKKPEDVENKENSAPPEEQEQIGTGYYQINDANRLDFMPIYNAVELIFLKHYRLNPKLKDKEVILSLKNLRDNLNKPKFKFSQMERDILNNLDKEIGTIKRSSLAYPHRKRWGITARP